MVRRLVSGVGPFFEVEIQFYSFITSQVFASDARQSLLRILAGMLTHGGMCTSECFELVSVGFCITLGKNLFGSRRRLLKLGSSGVFRRYGWRLTSGHIVAGSLVIADGSVS